MISSLTLNEFFSAVMPNFKVIKQNSNGKSPSYPYCAWRRVSSNGVGHPIVTQQDIVGSEELIERVKVQNVQVEFYSETEEQAVEKNISPFFTASEYADIFLNRIHSYESRAYQKNKKISLLRWTDYSCIDNFLGDVYEERATVELSINYIQTQTMKGYCVDESTINTTLTIEDI
jgi:hypothetical protein